VELTRDEKIELCALLEEREKRKIADQISCSGFTRDQSNAVYHEMAVTKNTAAQKRLAKSDLFYLLTVACNRKDIDHPWLYDRCREVEAASDGYLDLWARDHYKSTLITFGLTLQNILNDPEVTVGIFSHTRPTAKAFLEQIKRELETNDELKRLFPEVLYQNPHGEATKWSLDNGIVVKRKLNPKEATVEAWGLVDGQPTSKHFSHQIYDDVVTLESVNTPDQINKTTNAWRMSLNLGSGERTKRRYIGTRYHLHDTYSVIMDQGSAIPRVKPATHNGKSPPDGKPVFLSESLLLTKRRDQGPYVFGSQQLQDPVADKAMSFQPQWLKFYKNLSDTSKWNRYLIVDPANKKKKTSDYTVMAVFGLAPDNNYYLIDAIRDRLNLTQRATKVFDFHRKYQPIVGYEEYGMQADIEHIKYVMEQENYRFDIKALGGNIAKEDRIKGLIPVCEQGRLWLPETLPFIDHEATQRDFVQLFLKDEYNAFPVCTHDDMLDCFARILDPALEAKFPKSAPPKSRESRGYTGGASGWMG
jgi:predicted phage terminase large subunit-like protein